jgi:CheY-like chemotaxis protein
MRVLSNLVANAIRYTPHGAVRVRVERIDDAIGIHVQDTGIGIAPGDTARIFDEFYQIGNAERDRSRGLGLGLATVKRLSDLLTLGVKVESTPDVGSTFSVFVPPGQAKADLTPAAQLAAPHVDDTLSGRKLLVIDDEPQVRQGMRDLLTSWGHHVAMAANFAQARGHIEEDFVPDFIMADLRMAGGESGIDTIENLRVLLGRDVAAVLVSGDTQPEQMQAAKAARLTLLHKPVKPAHLRALLNQVFASQNI